MNDRQRGFANSPPEMWRTVENHADNDRTTLSLTGNYAPFEWFTNRLVTGLDVNAENNLILWPRQTVNADLLGANGLGTKSAGRATRSYITVDYSGSLKYGLRGLQPWRWQRFGSSR